MVPFFDWGGRVSHSKGDDEVIFPHLGGSFVSIAPVAVWVN